MRKYLHLGVALAVTLAVAGCGGSKGAGVASNSRPGSSKQYSDFRLGELDWPAGVSWKNFGWIPGGQLESLVVQQLVEVGPNGEPKPGLATSIEHPDATTYIYDFSKAIRFSDGKPVTAADVVYSLDLNRNPLALATYAPWKVVASVSAHGTSAVEVKLKRPSLDWPAIMSGSSQVIEKAPAVKAGGMKELGTQHGLQVGTGPWKFDSFTPESSVELSRNQYWTGPPQPAAKINVTVFKTEATMALALRSGAIDAASAYESQKLFGNIPGTHQLSGSQNWITWVSLPSLHPPFNDIHVRRAVAYATDVHGIINAFYPHGGAGVDPSIIPVPLLAGLGSERQANEAIDSLPKYDFDLAMAKRELARSAYPHGFTTTVSACVAEPVLVDVGQVVAAELAKIGITAKVRVLQNDECTVSYEDKIMFVNQYLSFLPNLPVAMMSTLLSPSNIYPSGTGENWGQDENPELAKLLPEVANGLDPAKRLQLATKVLRIAAVDEPYVPLFMHSTFMAVSNKFVSPSLSFYTTVYKPWMLGMKPAR